jgi:hypothetical protein
MEGTAVLIEYEAGWAPDLALTFGKEDNLLLLPGVEPWVS